MNLHMDGKTAEHYTSNAQRIRVITETWVNGNMFCPYCGNRYIVHFKNNRPVADFFCPSCREEYELKSKGASISKKVNDGAYNIMIERINSINNPNFFFMHYNKTSLQVENFVMVPKHFFSTDIIEKRKPLADTARRAGWVGCNILLNCVNQIENDTFTLEQMYQFETILSIKHQDNHHVRDKIRQQLQVLRDNGLIEFLGRGHYRKI